MGDVAAEVLIRNNYARGINPDGWTPSARWKREVDIPPDVLSRAEEGVWEGMGEEGGPEGGVLPSVSDTNPTRSIRSMVEGAEEALGLALSGQQDEH